MEKLIINGKRKLSGQLTLPAAKNAVLPLLALTVASRGDIRLRGCLPIADVVKMLDIQLIFDQYGFKIVKLMMKS